jgi:pimeloyl-ACP methyl ester carboxylesterase
MRHSSALTRHPYLAGAAATVTLLAIAALANVILAKKAERENPPIGKFAEIDAVRVHYAERGQGSPLVLLHGNGSMIEDFKYSGLIDLAAQKYRVIAFDRPGFGHVKGRGTRCGHPRPKRSSCRRFSSSWVYRARIVLGHSWGASVAVAMALNRPKLVRGLVLASGYYYPSARFEVVALSGPAVPLIGDLIRYTLAPIVARVMWQPLLNKIFGPAPVPRKFAGFPREMAFRPS